MKNPYVFWGLAIVAFVGGIFIGNSEWFKNLFISTENSEPRPTSDGQPCKTTVGNKPGVYKNGVCIDTGGMPIDDKAQRTNNYTDTNSEENIIARGASGRDMGTGTAVDNRSAYINQIRTLLKTALGRDLTSEELLRLNNASLPELQKFITDANSRAPGFVLCCNFITQKCCGSGIQY